MNSSNDHIFEEELKARGLRFTTQRKAVLDVIVKNEGKHLSPEEIYDLVKIDFPEIGIATVYRTLMLLEKMGFVHRMHLDDGKSRYEISRSEEDHLHHHLICIQCGSISEVKYDLLESLEDQILREDNFLVKNHSVKFYGYCKSCMKDETNHENRVNDKNPLWHEK
jgi:Fur family ferric uptake transcriptional regulator